MIRPALIALALAAAANAAHAGDARFEGRFAEYDGILHQVWLDGCKPARRH